MPSFAPLVPTLLLRSLGKRGRGAARLPGADRFPAALLFSDVSGFTALTERLQSRGRLGAEEMTDVVRSALCPAIRSVRQWGGEIVSFGGDAVFALFPGADAVGRARAAAAEIQDSFLSAGEIPTSVGPIRLGIDQAIHHGPVRVLHLGRADRRLLVVSSPSVEALARLESRASPGSVLVSRAAKARLARERKPRPVPALAPPPDELLAPYVPPHARILLGRFEGAFRRAVMLFLETRGASLAAMQSFVLTLLDLLDRYEGILVGTDLSPGGTKWLCAFGAPAAHEDDPDRAARAALELMSGLPRGMKARAGFHAGTLANIWMGDEARRSYELMGDATNVAARSLAKAAWGEVVTTEETRRLLTAVRTASRGRHAVKGKARPLALHAVVEAVGPGRPLRITAPMVGREAEMGWVRGALEEARKGRGSAIVIEAPPGLGKSRLKWEAAKHARQLGFSVHEGRAVAFGSQRYWAVVELLRDAMKLSREGADADVARLDDETTRLGLEAIERNHLGDVLGIGGASSPATHLKPDAVRINNNLAIRGYLLELARRDGPRLLVLEDMHWADELSLEAASRLVQRIHEAPVVLLFLQRPGGRGLRRAQRIVLSELSTADVASMLAALLGEVPGSVALRVADRAAGNPFYVEELVRHLRESGLLRKTRHGVALAREPGADDLPVSLESIIGSRLDRLPLDVRRVAQVCAAVGRTFRLDLLEHLEGDAARSAIELLAQRELVFLRDEGEREYIWKHALTRDVAYATILASQRRVIHRSVAAAIEEVLGRDAHLAMLAHHLEEAGQKAEARRCYLAAARRAIEAAALEEAERLYRRALALAAEPTHELIAARNELASEVLLASGRTADAKSELGRALREARAIGDRAGEGATLHHLGRVHDRVGSARTARSMFVRAIAISRELGDRRTEAARLQSLAMLAMEQGQMRQARVVLESALAIAREQGDRSAEGSALGNLSSLDREQGRMEEALGTLEESLRIAEVGGERRYAANRLNALGMLQSDTGRVAEARTSHERALALAKEVGDLVLQGVAISCLAGIEKDDGRVAEALPLAERALEISRAMGDRRREGIDLGNLAALHIDLEHFDQARTLLEQALAIAREVGDRRGEGIRLGHLANVATGQGRIEESGELLVQALAISRELEDPRFEGIWLYSLGTQRRLEGDLAEAAACVAQAEPLLRQVSDKLELALCVTERGHVLVASGEDASAAIAEATSLARDLSGEPSSLVAVSLARLERAQAARLEGRPTMCGLDPADVPPPLRAWLRRREPSVPV